MPESPSTELLTLGKGIVSVAEWSGGAPGTFRDVGNAPEFNVELVVETLDHFSSRSGARKKDKQAIIERGYKLAWNLDEMGKKNLEMYVMGTISGRTLHGLSDAGVAREYAVRFVSDNPEGPDARWEFWKCKIKPGGAVSLISDEWMGLPFAAEGLADDTLHASSPYFDVMYSTTTTTSSTTTTTTTG